MIGIIRVKNGLKERRSKKMTIDIGITRDGNYLVSVFRRDENGDGRWHELRCFESQGVARDFAYHDIPRFSDKEISMFIKTYDASKVFQRVGFKKYYRI